MLKFNGLLLTIALSFFTLCLGKAEGDLTLKKPVPTQQLHDFHALNTSAISVNNSFEELIVIDEHNTRFSENRFYAITRLSNLCISIDLKYLKACDFFNLNLTISKIIYPFHSFL
jgi:chromosome condensin MukBEF complex kleisin-like MukF subunit